MLSLLSGRNRKNIESSTLYALAAKQREQREHPAAKTRNAKSSSLALYYPSGDIITIKL